MSIQQLLEQRLQERDDLKRDQLINDVYDNILRVLQYYSRKKTFQDYTGNTTASEGKNEFTIAVIFFEHMMKDSKLRIPKEIKQQLKNIKAFILREPVKRASASYNKGYITIHVNPEAWKTISDGMASPKLVIQQFKDKEHDIKHELTHHIDWQRIDKVEFGGSQFQNIKDEKERAKKYYNHPLERNAYFHDAYRALKTYLKNNKLGVDPDLIMKELVKDFNAFKESMKALVDYESLENKKSFLKRTYSLWNEIKDEKEID